METFEISCSAQSYHRFGEAVIQCHLHFRDDGIQHVDGRQTGQVFILEDFPARRQRHDCYLVLYVMQREPHVKGHIVHLLHHSTQQCVSLLGRQLLFHQAVLRREKNKIKAVKI